MQFSACSAMENGSNIMIKTDATNLPRLMGCIGSRLLTPMVPVEETDNTIRDEGNAAHWLAYSVGQMGKTFAELIGTKAPNSIFITDEIAEHVQEYIEHLASREITFAAMEYDTSFAGYGFEIAARCDNIARSETAIYVDDFKYGWRITEPENNWTLIAHAIGFVIRTGFVPERIVFTIHQPRPTHRLGKMRSWEISYSQLLDFYNEINARLSNPSDELTTGAHCAKCPALYPCPAARMAAMNAIEISEMAYNEELDNVQLSGELENLERASKALSDRLDALKEVAKHRLINGQIIKNYAVDRSFGNTTWKKGITPEILKAISGIDCSVGKLATPNQVIKRGMPENAVKSLTYRPETGIKLIRIDADKFARKILGK